MAFGTSSKIFTVYVESSLENTAAFDADSDTIRLALYNNTGTPDQTVSAANSAYAVGQWVTGNEVTATGWTAGGLSLASIVSGYSSVTYSFTSATRTGGASDTVTNAYGCLIYDDTLTTPVADQGMCYNAFGGANSVVSGTFSVAPNTNWFTFGV